MKNMIDLNEFKTKKEGTSLQESIVTKVGDNWNVQITVPVPSSLVNAFAKKVKDETTVNIKETKSDNVLADEMVNYITTSFLNIENLPVNLAVGDDYTTASVQPEIQTQGQVQNLQPEEQTQIQDTETDLTAQEIPAQEGGQTQVVQPVVQPGVQTIQAQ